MKAIRGIVGSLRKGSFNRGLMLAAMDAGKEAGLEIKLFDRLAAITMYNADLDTDESAPGN